MLLRASKKHQSVLSLSDGLGKDKDGGEIAIEDVVQSDEDVAQNAENVVLAQKLTNMVDGCLSSREKQIVVMRYGLGNTPVFTQQEIAKKLGISRSYISRLEKKALEILKEKAKREDLF